MVKISDLNNGRFTSRDTWDGDINSPMSFNRWNYVEGNPVNYTDPSGHLACKDVVSKFRDIFEKLGLCNPDEEPTISSQRMEELEKWSDPNITPCVFVMTANGLQCTTQETETQDDCSIIVALSDEQISSNNVSKKDCQTAIKLLMQYERLAQKFGVKLSPERLKELNRKRDLGIITSYDLPGTISREMPPQFRGLSLQKIRELCGMKD